MFRLEVLVIYSYLWNRHHGCDDEDDGRGDGGCGVSFSFSFCVTLHASACSLFSFTKGEDRLKLPTTVPKNHGKIELHYLLQ